MIIKSKTVHFIEEKDLKSFAKKHKCLKLHKKALSYINNSWDEMDKDPSSGTIFTLQAYKFAIENFILYNKIVDENILKFKLAIEEIESRYEDGVEIENVDTE